MYNALTSIYKCAKGRVRNSSASLSQLFNCPQGLRQGCVLSPLLFSFFINELALERESSCYSGVQLHPDVVQIFLLLFADDVVLFADTVYGLQKRINVLGDFCERHQLSVKLEKTKVVVFKNGNKLSKHENWFLNGNRLQIVSSYKYLGVILSRSLCWSAHVKSAVLQANKILYSVFKSLHLLKPLPYDLFFKIFDTKICPIIFYGCEIWGLDNFKDIEILQMFACKRFLGAKSATSNHVVRGECGRFPMYIFTYKRALSYWCKLCNMPNTRFVKKCYNLLLLDCINGKTNWTTKIKNILYLYGFGYIWEEQCVVHANDFLSAFVYRLKVAYEQDWHAALINSSKYSSYISFKSSFGLEPYIKEITICKFRTAFAQFRCFSHQLRIETGRYIKELKTYRLCVVCKERYVEDEYHFVLVCNAYNKLRSQYLPQKYYNYPTVYKFNMLMSNVNPEILKICYVCV